MIESALETTRCRVCSEVYLSVRQRHRRRGCRTTHRRIQLVGYRKDGTGHLETASPLGEKSPNLSKGAFPGAPLPPCSIPRRESVQSEYRESPTEPEQVQTRGTIRRRPPRWCHSEWLLDGSGRQCAQHPSLQREAASHGPRDRLKGTPKSIKK